MATLNVPINMVMLDSRSGKTDVNYCNNPAVDIVSESSTPIVKAIFRINRTFPSWIDINSCKLNIKSNYGSGTIKLHRIDSSEP